MEKYLDIDHLKKMVMDYAPQVLLAIIVLLAGLKIINAIVKFFAKTLGKRNVDPTLIPFLRSQWLY